jgi:hypothetical protein
MSISDMVRAAYARMADVCVDVDESFGGVAIGAPEEGIYMQGDEANEFIAAAQALYDELGDVTIDEVYAYMAEPYADSL